MTLRILGLTFIAIVSVESIIFVFIFCRKTNIAKKIVRFLAKLQDIDCPITMAEIDARLEEICKEEEKRSRKNKHFV